MEMAVMLLCRLPLLSLLLWSSTTLLGSGQTTTSSNTTTTSTQFHINPPLATCNTTTSAVLEYNIGIIGFYGMDVPGWGFFHFVPIFRFIDLDFQSTWNPTVKVRWGPSYFFNGVSMNPCLRIRIMLLNTQWNQIAYLQALLHSIYEIGVSNQPDFFYIPESGVQTGNILAGTAVDRITVTTNSNARLGDNRPLDNYPYHFRYAQNYVSTTEVVVQYVTAFGFRTLAWITGMDEDSIITHTRMIKVWAQSRTRESLRVDLFPSKVVPYPSSSVATQLEIFKDQPNRLVYIDLPGVPDPALSNTDCDPKHVAVTGGYFLLCFLRNLTTAGIRAPTYQIFFTDGLMWYGPNRPHLPALLWGHWLERPFFLDGLFQRTDQLEAELIKRVKPQDYPLDYGDRLGLQHWNPRTLWIGSPNIWANTFPSIQSGKWSSTFFPSESKTYVGQLVDSMIIFIYAVSAAMDKKMPPATSKSNILVTDIQTEMRSAVPTYSLVFGSNAVTMPNLQPDSYQILISKFYVRQFNRTNWTAGSWPPQGLFRTWVEASPLGSRICCGSAQYATPTWSTGESLPLPPSSLSKCSPGSSFNSTSQICTWCPPGEYSTSIDVSECSKCSVGTYSIGKSTGCTQCSTGKFANEVKMSACIWCLAGTYSDQLGMSDCLECVPGTYFATTGATACKQCRGTLSTKNPGAVQASDCVCPQGHFSRNFHASYPTCERCMDGLDCDTGWPSSWNAIGNPISIAQVGFYTTASSPYETYKCCDGITSNCGDDCPGGIPESCVGGRTGLVCDQCIQDAHYIDGKECKECSEILKLMVLIFVLVSAAGVTAAYYFTNGRLTVNADNPLAFMLFVGLVITSVQVFGVLEKLDIPWPTEAASAMRGSSSTFSLDASSINIECAVGKSAVTQYLIQVLLPYMILSEVTLLFLVSKVVNVFVGKPAWESQKALNVAGQLMQALFIAFCGIMTRPFECYEHPNGKSSVVLFPRVLCYTAGDHTVLLVLSGVICFFFIIPFASWCAWGCWKAPVESSRGNMPFLQRYRFLLYRFRPDVWWWGLVFLLRQTCLAFAAALPSDNPHAHIFYSAGILSIYGFACCRLWPWICSELSYIDSGTMLLLILILLNATQFLPTPAEANKGRMPILVCLFVLFGLLLLRYIGLVLASVYSHGVTGEFGSAFPNRMMLCKKWLLWLEYSHNLTNSDVVDAVCRMNGFDRESLYKFLSSWNAVLEDSVEGSKWRLKGLPSRAPVQPDKKAQLAKGSSRKSSREFDQPIPFQANDEDQCETNIALPKSFRVLASTGTALTFGNGN